MSKQPKTTPKSQQKQLSNRTFGLIFAGIFAVISLLPLAFGSELRLWAAYVVGAFAIPALLFPTVLAPLNRGWAKFGQFMHKIINPILMGLIFFLTVLPTGLLMRLFGKDPMHRKLDSDLDSYWIAREDSLTKESFDNQF